MRSGDFPDLATYRDDIAAIAAEVKRHREVEALLPTLIAVIQEARPIVAEHMAWVNRNVGPEPMYPKTLARMDEAVDRARELLPGD